ncbi:MAG: LAGLIDADG family homing endonuclease [archaeon]
MKRFSDFEVSDQQEIYANVLALRDSGFGYKKIRNWLSSQGISISLGTLSYWRNKKKNFTSRKNSFEAIPSKELAYVLGVMFGDGAISRHEKNHDYCIHLGAIDKEFVEKFSECVSRLLGKKQPYPVHWCKSGIYEANIRSKELYFFIKGVKENLDTGKPFIEKHPAEFIQGLADSEGCPAIRATNKFSVSVCIAASTNINLLFYSKDLIYRKYDISSTIYTNHKSGDQDSTIDGRLITRTKDVFGLHINKIRNVEEFCKKIGFSIIRKQKKLLDALFVFKKFGTYDGTLEWKKLYEKINNKWRLVKNEHHSLCRRAP